MEDELIAKIRKLKQIKPEKKWVFLTKKRILGEIEIFPFFKPVYAGLFLIFLLIGLFGVSQKSLPGEPLYYIKKVGEKFETTFLPEEEKPKANLELARRRVEELKRVVEKNDVSKLPAAINEFQNTVSQARENWVKSGIKADKEVVKTTLAVVSDVEEIKAKGIEINDQDLKEIVEYLIKDFETRTLTEKQKEILERAKEYFETENYLKAADELSNLSDNR